MQLARRDVAEDEAFVALAFSKAVPGDAVMLMLESAAKGISRARPCPLLHQAGVEYAAKQLAKLVASETRDDAALQASLLVLLQLLEFRPAALKKSERAALIALAGEGAHQTAWAALRVLATQKASQSFRRDLAALVTSMAETLLADGDAAAATAPPQVLLGQCLETLCLQPDATASADIFTRALRRHPGDAFVLAATDKFVQALMAGRDGGLPESMRKEGGGVRFMDGKLVTNLLSPVAAVRLHSLRLIKALGAEGPTDAAADRAPSVAELLVEVEEVPTTLDTYRQKKMTMSRLYQAPYNSSLSEGDVRVLVHFLLGQL